MHTIDEARAHSRGPVQLTAGGWRPAMRWDGPSRAAARAHGAGLRVGYPVRAQVMTKTPPDPQRPLVPLEFGERISNYRIQQAVRTHNIGGTNWRPTPRQRRRLEHKARAAAVRKYLDGKREEARIAAYTLAMPAERVAAWDEPVRLGVAPPTMSYNPPPRGPMIAQGNGFRVVDRRGEHR